MTDPDSSSRRCQLQLRCACVRRDGRAGSLSSSRDVRGDLDLAAVEHRLFVNLGTQEAEIAVAESPRRWESHSSTESAFASLRQEALTLVNAKWDAIIAINLSAAFHTIRAVVAEMKAQKWGRIINMASAHALVASPFKSAYVAAKHGVLGLTKTVALETAEHGITVNAICPGYVLTPLVEKQIPETAKARGITEQEVITTVLLHAQPTRQFVTTEQIGALAVFLCSNEAASITGAALPIDGGWTAQ